MVPVPVLPTGLNRSRSSSNAAPHSRERSATLVSTSTHTSAGTMSTLTPSEASMAAGQQLQQAPPPVPPPPGSMPLQGTPGASARKEPPKPLDMGDVLKYSGGAPRGVPPTGKESGQNPEAIYQAIQEASAKRISSLDYLKKTHEPRVFWFNTLLYTQPDIARLPSFSASRISRRATNFLLLGVSLPSVIDLNTSSPTDYLKALNALLVEFEDYEKQHPSDGSASGPTRRLGTIFGRKNTGAGKRRTSSAADIGLPIQSSDPAELKNLIAQNGPPGLPEGGTAGHSIGLGLNGAGIPPANSDVIPGGELAAGGDFNWLRTPSIPIEPDFFEVFVTLCDMLIECYSRIASLVSSASVCSPETSEIFVKADGKIKRVVFEGIIKEFVEHTRAGVKNEIGGIGKIILGGLM